MFLKTLPMTAIVFLLSACGANDSNPKDYWNLKEPELFLWDSSEDANLRGYSDKVSKINVTNIKKTLDYPSYIQFEDLTSENKITVQSTCRMESKEYSFITGGDILNSKDIEDTKELAKHSIDIPSSLKIYFYNFLPKNVLQDTEYSNQSPDYNCNFTFTVFNKITSSKKFYVNDLKINTYKSNAINIGSILKNDNQPTATIISAQHKQTEVLPQITYASSLYTYVINKNLPDAQLVGPGFIQCLGEKNRFEIESQNGSLGTFLEQPFRELLGSNKNTSFLKKCRVQAKLRLPSEESKLANNVRTVWSEYFDVIFDEPKIKFDVTKVDLNTETNPYPFNNGTYLDKSVTLFKIKVKNNSEKNIKIKLPTEQKIEATLTALVYNIQRHNFTMTPTNWGGADVFELPKEFKTEIKFMSKGERVFDIYLGVGAESEFNLVVDKNFSCNLSRTHIDFNRLTVSNATAERGFRLRAIELKSAQDTIKVDYLNQDQMEEFPSSFFLSELLQTSSHGLPSIQTSDSNKNIFETNLLQLMTNRTTSIDTIYLRNNEDLIPPMVSKKNPWKGLPHDVTLHSMTQQVQNIKNNNPLPTIVQTYLPDQEYCEQVY